MQQFPVISSILSAAHLALLLQETHGLSKATTCRIIKAGVNHSYMVTDGASRYVLRVYALNWRTPNDIMEELRLINLLRDKGISLSYPIPDHTGNYIQEISAPEGVRPAVLFSIAHGEKVLNFPAETHYAIGKIMAEMHRHTLNLKLDRTTYTPQTLLIDPLEEMKPFLSANSGEMAFMRTAQGVLLKELAGADTKQIRQGAVHLDIWFDNLNIDSNGKITLFDFDFCGNGWLCLDMAYYIMQVHSTEKDKSERDLKVEHFILGYESVTPVSDEEKRLIPALGVCLYFFYLGVQSKRYDNWSNMFLHESYLKRYITVLVKAYYDAHQLG